VRKLTHGSNVTITSKRSVLALHSPEPPVGLTAQRLQILAQSFSRLQPWACSRSESALKGRPMQIGLNRRLAFMASQRDSRLIRAHAQVAVPQPTLFDSAALFGRIRWLPDPGLKPG
jgi:hypothetical protein